MSEPQQLIELKPGETNGLQELQRHREAGYEPGTPFLVNGTVFIPLNRITPPDPMPV